MAKAKDGEIERLERMSKAKVWIKRELIFIFWLLTIGFVFLVLWQWLIGELDFTAGLIGGCITMSVSRGSELKGAKK